MVIDDAGVDRRRTREVISLPGPLTIAFLTYARRLDEQVKSAVSAGHEILTHVPMQPVNVDANPGKNALNTDLKPAEVKSRLKWALTRIPGHVGINNHMGSRYTSHEKGMQLVMAELRKRGLLFLDSRTSRDTVGAKLAKIYRVPHAVRNIFLDHDPKLASIKNSLPNWRGLPKKRVMPSQLDIREKRLLRRYLSGYRSGRKRHGSCSHQRDNRKTRGHSAVTCQIVERIICQRW